MRQVISVSPTGSVTHGNVAEHGAVDGWTEMASKVDIELDPWAGLIVDNRGSVESLCRRCDAVLLAPNRHAKYPESAAPRALTPDRARSPQPGSS